MPIDSAEFHAQAHPCHLSAAPHLGSRPAEGHETAHQMQPMRRGDEVEERIGWIGGDEIPRDVQLLPSQELPNQEYDGGHSPREQADDYAVRVVPTRGHVCPLQRDLLVTRT